MYKYDDLLEQLHNDELYSSGRIVQLARARVYLTEVRALLRMRIALNARANRACFDSAGDGLVKLAGQAPTPGWFGWRWKKLVDQRNSKDVAQRNEAGEEL